MVTTDWRLPKIHVHSHNRHGLNGVFKMTPAFEGAIMVVEKALGKFCQNAVHEFLHLINLFRVVVAKATVRSVDEAAAVGWCLVHDAALDVGVGRREPKSVHHLVCDCLLEIALEVVVEFARTATKAHVLVSHAIFEFEAIPEPDLHIGNVRKDARIRSGPGKKEEDHGKEKSRHSHVEAKGWFDKRGLMITKMIRFCERYKTFSLTLVSHV